MLSGGRGRLCGLAHRGSSRDRAVFIKRVCWAMAKALPKYPRYTAHALRRPPGAGAFFDYAAAMARRYAPKFESSRLVRAWGKGLIRP